MPPHTADVSTRSLVLQLFAFVVFANQALVLLGVVWLDHTGRALIREGEQYSATVFAQGLANAVLVELISGDYDGLDDQLEKAMSTTMVAELLVFDETGRLVAQTSRSVPGARASGRYRFLTIQPPAARGRPTVSADLLSAWVPVDPVTNLGWVYVRFFGGPAQARLDRLRSHAIGFGVFGGAMVVLLLLVSFGHTTRSLGRRELALLEHQAELEEAVSRDRLTGLPNRVALLERLAGAVAGRQPGGQPLAVCFVDLDGFKAVNDRWGHDVGDALLIAVARRLEGSVRQTDTVARLAGDEFVLLLDGEQQPGELHRLLDRVIGAVRERVAIGTTRVKVGCSIGVALCASAGADPEVLLRQADEAMYAAKRLGRNRWVLHESAAGSLLSPEAALARA